MKIERKIYKEDDINIANLCKDVGVVCMEMKKLGMAIAYMSEALEIYKKMLGEGHDLCICLKNDISQIKSELEHNSH